MYVSQQTILQDCWLDSAQISEMTDGYAAS